jgi:acetyltransferase-like isoleucine patch superfamily enzyme
MDSTDNGGEGVSNRACSSFIPWLYGLNESPRLQALLRKLVLKLEGGAMYSMTVREIYRRFHRVEVGLYTIGPCEAGPGNFGPGSVIGRYSSIYYTVRTFTRDPMAEMNSRHGLYFESAFSGPGGEAVPSTQLLIGNDVFIGHNAVIMASASQIGDGAFVGAGSIVQNPVPPYAVVMGNPARVVRYRFSAEKIKELLQLKWWTKSVDQLRDNLSQFQRPLESDVIR